MPPFKKCKNILSTGSSLGKNEPYFVYPKLIIHNRSHDIVESSKQCGLTDHLSLISFQVGHEMTSSTDDSILRQDMPQALHKVNGAAKLLEEAAKLSRIDPYSKAARGKLIEGSRLILQVHTINSPIKSSSEKRPLEKRPIA